jgi:hypothetical protein
VHLQIKSPGGLADLDGAVVEFGQCGWRQHITWPPYRCGCSFAEEEHIGRRGREFFDVMRDQNCGGWPGIGLKQGLYRRKDLLAGQKIEAGGGLVEN